MKFEWTLKDLGRRPGAEAIRPARGKIVCPRALLLPPTTSLVLTGERKKNSGCRTKKLVTGFRKVYKSRMQEYKLSKDTGRSLKQHASQPGGPLKGAGGS